MVAVLRSVVALMLLLGQVWLGAAAGLIPDVERRRHAPEHSERFLRDFELRLLNMFGLKRKPTPSKGAVVPQYMLDLYYMHSEDGDQKSIRRPRSIMGRHAERAASRANTIRSFHHEGEISLIYYWCVTGATDLMISSCCPVPSHILRMYKKQTSL